jgi:4-diphosphocytidyl-2C-methyl-D-erythritol kinase
VHNALQGAAEALSPAVAELLRALRRESLYGAALSGSGSACFGVSGNRQQAFRSAARLRQTLDCQTWVVRTTA